MPKPRGTSPEAPDQHDAAIGVLSAVKRRTLLDRLSMGIALFGISAPVFWLGLMGLYIFWSKLGWVGGGGMSALLRASIGESNAALMLMTGDPVTASQAERWHLVSEVTRPDDLMDRAHAIAEVVASRAPIAAETAKANLRAAATMPLDQAMTYERDLQTVCFTTEDAAEGRAAFRERRPAVFQRK